MTNRDELEDALFRTMWAACNLHMQLIRSIESSQRENAAIHEAHKVSVEDRVNELGTELENLRRCVEWPDDDERSNDP